MPSSITRVVSELRSRVDAAEQRLERSAAPPSPLEFGKRLGLELDDWQREILTGSWKRALLNVTRQGGKSTVAALLGLHEALYRPGSLTLIVSPSDRQSAELFRKLVELRDRIPTSEYTLSDDTKRSMTVVGGGRVASLPGSEATIRGFSAATLIVEDEASRVEDELYQAVRPMLATTDGRLLLLSTPFGRRGHYWKEWTDGGDGWKRVRVPATKIPRITSAFLEEERAALGDWWYRQEYLCEFVQTDDAFFLDHVVQEAISSDVKPLFQLGGTP